MKIKTKSWSEILAFYNDLQVNYQWKVEPMLELVKYINTSKYKIGLHAYTSHSSLIIDQYLEIDDYNAIIKVDYDPDNFEIIFSYREDNSLKYCWTKSFPDKDVILEFEKLMAKLKWVY